MKIDAEIYRGTDSSQGEINIESPDDYEAEILVGIHAVIRNPESDVMPECSMYMTPAQAAALGALLIEESDAVVERARQRLASV